MSLEHNKDTFKTIFKLYLEEGGKEGDRILDFGCGEGWSTIVGKEMNLEVIGLELDPKYWVKGCGGDQHEIHEIQVPGSDIRFYDGKEFPFPDNYFNGLTAKVSLGKDFTVPKGNVVAGSILDKSHAQLRIQEIYRVLVPESIVILYQTPGKMFHLLESLLPKEQVDKMNLTVLSP